MTEQFVRFTLKSVVSLDQLQTGVTTENTQVTFKIDTLIPEDGSGQKFLINFQNPKSEVSGYLNMKTMRGFLQKNNG